MPISFRPHGRLGNFLYMAAAMYGYSRKNSIEYSMPSVTNDVFWNPLYLQHLVNPKFEQRREDILLNENWNINQHFYEIEFKEEWRDSYIVINGYHQSFKHFDFCREEMLKDFNFHYEYKEGWCSIHVRRGDYLQHPTKHPVVTMGYINKAIDYILANTDTTKFMVFSDDIAWCKENIKRDEYITFSEGRNEIEDLTLMSHCAHNICSNSTMALWGAELNQNPKKVVIVPGENNWFGHDNRIKMTVKDLYRPEWVKIAY